MLSVVQEQQVSCMAQQFSPGMLGIEAQDARMLWLCKKHRTNISAAQMLVEQLGTCLQVPGEFRLGCTASLANSVKGSISGSKASQPLQHVHNE